MRDKGYQMMSYRMERDKGYQMMSYRMDER